MEKKNYNHVIKNKILPDGRLISDYEIMTGVNLSEIDMAYIDEIGILPIAPRNQWIVPKGFVIGLFGQVQKIGLEK